MLKTKKWYSSKIKPDRHFRLIVMTDMGYIFESTYENGQFLVSKIRDHKVYFEPWLDQTSIIKWMKL